MAALYNSMALLRRTTKELWDKESNQQRSRAMLTHVPATGLHPTAPGNDASHYPGTCKGFLLEPGQALTWTRKKGGGPVVV